jgi:hypothetical protein
MIGRFLSYLLLLALPLAGARYGRATEPATSEAQPAAVAAAPSDSAVAPSATATTPTALPSSLVVLRNGEILSGQISRDGDRTVVRSEGTEIRLSPREVDFVCQSLDEAYAIQGNRVVAGRIEDHLNLADWCLRHELLGYAAREITAAMQIDPKSRRVALLDARLHRALTPETTKTTEIDKTTAAARPISAEELERLVRSLPAGTVESFTSTVQPMLLNYCATAGCHGPSSTSSYTLSRSPLEKVAARRLTERNLYNTLQWLDHDNPLDSKLLSAAREPHGPNQASGATGVGTAKYQELANWVLQASPNVVINPNELSARNFKKAPAATLPVGNPAVLASPSPATVLLPTDQPPAAINRSALRAHKTPGSGVVTAGAVSGVKAIPPIQALPAQAVETVANPTISPSPTNSPKIEATPATPVEPREVPPADAAQK